MKKCTLAIIFNLIVSLSYGHTRDDLALEAKLLAKTHSQSYLSEIRLQYRLYLQHKSQCEYEGKLGLLPLGCLDQLGILYKWGIIDRFILDVRRRNLLKVCEQRATQQTDLFELKRALQDRNLKLTNCLQISKKRMDILIYKNPDLAMKNSQYSNVF